MRGKLTCDEGGADVVDRITGLRRTPTAVSITETGQTQTPRILSGLASEMQEYRKLELKGQFLRMNFRR